MLEVCNDTLLVVYVGEDFEFINEFTVQNPNSRLKSCKNSLEAATLIDNDSTIGAIVCEYKLPGQNGIAFFNTLQARIAELKIPFVLLHSTKDGELRKEALRSGIDDFYTKPIGLNGLYDRLAFLKELKGKEGFGYDPIFKPNGYEATFAQMAISLKGKIGHRGRAMQQFLSHLRDE